MISHKIDEVSADIDDAATVVEELQIEPDADTERLDELEDTLKNASDTIDEISEEDGD